jgi:hypothetical protein
MLEGETTRLVSLGMMVSLALVALVMIMMISRRLFGKDRIPR